MKRFAGHRAIVTAAASGIACTIAEKLVEEGAEVFAGDIVEAGLADQVGLAGYGRIDVSQVADVDSFFSAALEALGGVDILINAAGTKGPTGDIEATDPEEWAACLQVNLAGAYHCMRPVLAAMKAQGSGSIVNFSSTAGLFGFARRSPYCAAKWGIIGLTKAAAAEAGPFGVRVNALCPGSVEGARIDRVIADEAQATGRSEAEVRQGMTDGISLGCFVTAEDVAEMALFLCSPSGARISGQAIAVDGHTSML